MKNLTSKLLLAGACFLWLASAAAVAQKVTLCHNGTTISVSPSAVNSHLNHGDVLGTCPGDCIDPNLIDPNRACIMLYDPVCGCNGVTYSNGCVATFFYGVTSYTPGACQTPCVGQPQPIFCPTYVDPVCGCDGVTYSNACFATAAGVTSTTPGACGGGTLGKRISDLALAPQVAPNPASGIATLSWTPAHDGSSEVAVTDMMGKVVLRSEPMASQAGVVHSFQFDAARLQAGVYLVQVKSGAETSSQKLVVQH